MEIIVVKIFSALILPPGLMLLMIASGYLIKKRFYRSGVSLIYLGLGLLLLLSLPLVADLNSRLIQDVPLLTEQQMQSEKADAIVVLSGGRIHDSPEYGKDYPAAPVLQRIMYAAYLQRKTGLPVLVSGGSVYDQSAVSEARLIKNTLENELNVPVRWIEERSRNTWENALFSQQLLEQHKIRKIYLVTQAWHMSRSLMAFKSAGLEPVAAPTGFIQPSRGIPFILRLIPSSRAFDINRQYMHEVAGLLWYRLRYVRNQQD